MTGNTISISRGAAIASALGLVILGPRHLRLDPRAW